LISGKSGASDNLLNKSLLVPIDYPNLVRLGMKGDGGYVIPEDEIRNCALLISLGLSDNWEFDKEFLARNPDARVIGVDHTVGPMEDFHIRPLVQFSKDRELHFLLAEQRRLFLIF
jgi:hypothetical protein